MPQEIEVWYLIPALRRELARFLVADHKVSQREAAKMLGITEAAISQYISKKRGSDVKFSKEEIKKIRKSSNNIFKNQEKTMKEIYKLSKEFRGSKALCNLHKKHDSSISKDCDVCLR